MTKQIQKLNEKSSQEHMQQIIEQRVRQARKEEVLEIYEDLLQTIWNRILPTLGRVTVMAIVERALVLVKKTHPVVGHLQVTPEGVSFDELRQQMEDEEREVVRDSLKELVANLIDILAMLTGDILVRQLIKEIEVRQP